MRAEQGQSNLRKVRSSTTALLGLLAVASALSLSALSGAWGEKEKGLEWAGGSRVKLPWHRTSCGERKHWWDRTPRCGYPLLGLSVPLPLLYE